MLLPKENIKVISKDGEAIYYPEFLIDKEASEILKNLLIEIIWENDRLIIFGKERIMSRKTAWYAVDNLSYSYSGTTKIAKLFTPTLKLLVEILNQKLNLKFNACLLNLYHDGNEGMGWHSDDERELVKNGAIASLSLGEKRKFQFQHKVSKEIINLELENGSCLLMSGAIQKYWKHALPKSKKYQNLRLNLTFRQMKVDE